MNLVENHNVKPAGLGVRDACRIEAGLCLHGLEMSKDMTPVESDLEMFLPKKRLNNEEDTFHGKDRLLRDINELRKKPRRVGLELIKGTPFRTHYKLFKGDEEVGEVSSGIHSTYLNKGVGMGFVDRK